ncbi:protein amnionless isoform X2 [Narcine bancroftii]|uniref:protein amnionless isoform X2 n=1 Tax=Narcine bancroftii TaxID=1343680 RepID=UPI003831ECB6
MKIARVQFLVGKAICGQHTLSSVCYSHMPLDGEFILGHNAGFTPSDGQSEPGCERGGDITFKDPDQYKWYNPKYWKTSLSKVELKKDKYTFTLDEESVPCQYDDVSFPPGTSFHVDLGSDAQNINVKTVSLMNRKFTNSKDFDDYKQSKTGNLQFHGNGSIIVTNAKCEDKSGCECGNSDNHRRICYNLEQEFGNYCAELDCTNPFKPQGHCCEICGAVIYLKYDQKFDLEIYREQLINLFLDSDDAKGVRMSMTKIDKGRFSKQTYPSDAVPRIQIVLIDNATKSATQFAAQLAQEIMAGINSQGDAFGIVSAELQKSTNGVEQGRGSLGTGTISGIVIGVLLAAMFTGGLTFLCITGQIRIKIALPLISFKNNFHPNIIETVKGFSNPMFYPQVSPLTDVYSDYLGEHEINIVPRRPGANIISPLYDGDNFGEQEC